MQSHEAMALAIELAKKGYGQVSPNPLVGCVVLDKNKNFLSSGCHEKYGEAHAEVNALKNLNEGDLVGAHVYVTLEPCSFVGNTPSCAETLAKLPIASLHYGLQDPHPKVSGKGLEMLKQAGIKVLHMVEFAEQCEELAETFLFNQRYQLPFVAIKIATSLDGQIGLKSGESQWITGEAARNYGHYLRAGHDAILIGSGTFHKDNPNLNVRHSDFTEKNNKVVILDATNEVASEISNSNIFKTHSAQNIFLVVEDSSLQKAKEESGVTCIGLQKNSKGKFDLKALMQKLYKQSIRSIYVEGGGATYASLLESGLVQRVYNFIAPTIIGANQGQSWTNGIEISHLKDQLRLRSVRHQHFGEDFLITGRI